MWIRVTGPVRQKRALLATVARNEVTVNKAIVLFVMFLFPAISAEAGTRPRLGAEPLDRQVSLGCYISSNGHQFYVGNAHTTVIAKGTRISFSGKVDNGEMRTGTVPVESDIPPHLFVILMYNPRFDPRTPCKAWIDLPPVVK